MKEDLKENLKPIIFIVIVLVLAAISAYPQRAFGGKVVEVLDGKTCVIEMANGRVTAVLQYIEIPEPDQPMHSTVREHLQALILGKTVEFQPGGVKWDKTFGKLFVKGVDVSQQMLRDGAAWYSVPEKNGQNEAESLRYQDNETQARTEKRGVWSVENLKPAWEYRAEKEALRKQQEQETLAKLRLAREEKKQKLAQRQGPAPQVEMWADVGGANAFDQPLGYGGLRAGYDPGMKVGHVSTPSIYLDFPNSNFLQKVDSRIFYVYKGDKTKIEDSVYIIGFITTTKEYRFLKSNSLTITADSQKLSLGKAKRFYRQDMSSVKELLLYKITRAQLMKIAQAGKISVQIGSDKGVISNESLTIINNLLNAS
ncbi:MAG TPA: thermonuclease family protein [Pyrinomonadaceae bacterium]|nr:thermonuclease family protein [Pyrinomonadaceae bacterium]